MKVDKLQVVQAINPKTNAGGATGTYISLKNVIKCLVVVHCTDATTDTTAITLEQSTAVAGSGHTAITQVVPIWSNLDCSTSNTLTSRTAAVSYTTNASVKNKIVVFQVDPIKLDAGYDVVNVVVGGSSASNSISAVYLLEMRYSGADVIAD